MVTPLYGLVADHNVEAHVELLVSILEGKPFEEMWSFLALHVLSSSISGRAVFMYRDGVFNLQPTIR